jgi:hypothetical protein
MLRWVTRPVTFVAVVAIVVLGVAVGVTARLSTRAPDTHKTTGCHAQRAFVPAFFYASGIWQQAADTKPVPSYMILDISGTGAGAGPVAHFQSMVKQERAAGVTILGYSSVGYALQRPLSQVEADVRHYKAWYGVTNIFLDEVRGIGSQLPYYRKLANYIRTTNPGSSIWINPGNYPDPSYMSVSNVVMAFEGPYTAYHNVIVPSWAFDYNPDRFANTIYATRGSQVASALSLSRSRNAGYVYVTDGTGANPYSGLPSYWSTEDSDITQGCPNSAS